VEIDYTYSPAEDPRDQLEQETEDPDAGGRGNIVSAIGGNEEPIGDGDSKITAMGGALLSGLVVAAIGVLFIVFRRRKQRRFVDHDLDDSMDKTDIKTDMDMHHAESLETLQLEVLSDGMGNNSSPRRSQERYDESLSNQSYEYKFDLGNSMKNDVMGAYGGGGPTSMAVVSPYPMSGEDASEVDSWAQTDGTVGSLEDNLEEITAEI
jgi:hypothetical protein